MEPLKKPQPHMSATDRKAAFGMMLAQVQVDHEIGVLPEGSIVSVGKLVEKGASTSNNVSTMGKDIVQHGTYGKGHCPTWRLA